MCIMEEAVRSYAREEAVNVREEKEVVGVHDE